MTITIKSVTNNIVENTLIIKGGNRLKGEIEPIPNKNSFMAVLPAAVLSDKDIVYKDAPKTTDVKKHLEILKLLGAKVNDSDYSKITINCSSLNSFEIDSPLASEFRSSIMYVGPLLARFGRAKVPLPGGCTLGARSINAHIEVFKKLGAEIKLTNKFAEFIIDNTKVSTDFIWQKEVSVTASENFALYAAGIDSKITLYNSACEPHVYDLLTLLSQVGADIEGAGSNRITVKGTKIFKTAVYTPTPDPIDIAGFIVAAAITDGEITIKNGNIPLIVDGMISHLSPFNINIKKENDDLIVKRAGELYIDPVKSGFPLAANDLPKFNPGPWPNFPVDALPVAVTLATKTKGNLFMQNWMYETGFSFASVLNELGAKIFISDPQRIIVEGPCKYKGGEVPSPRVIQACKALFLAALADPVRTTIHGVDVLYRRYPDIVNVYKSLGADISTE